MRRCSTISNTELFTRLFFIHAIYDTSVLQTALETREGLGVEKIKIAQGSYLAITEDIAVFEKV